MERERMSAGRISRRAVRTSILIFAACWGVWGPAVTWRAMGPTVAYTRAHADITYIYDALGRLVGVVDPAGDTGVYQYDAVGNLTGIARYSSSIISIIDVSPGSGPVGTSVTIAGTGFSPTPGQNTVTFNGTSATVTASTATQIVTTVPVGATTGSIAVTAPAAAGGYTSSVETEIRNFQQQIEIIISLLRGVR
jgi:YD repeat-containing protein